MTRSHSILLAIALGAACAGPSEQSVAPDSGPASNSQSEAIHWPVEAGVSSFVTQSAARSEEPFPCGSGVNSQHILQGEHGDNHDYEQSLDIVARNLGADLASTPVVAHEGRGTDIVAVADGVVVAMSAAQSECVRDLGAGNYVILEHPQLGVDGSPVLSAYMHLNSSTEVERSQDCGLNPSPMPEGGFQPLAVGTTVVAGQKIGELGNTGNSTGPHLHFQFASSCTLVPADAVECTAISVLDVSPRGFTNVAVARDETCPESPAIGGPVAASLSPTKYLSDGSYVTGRPSRDLVSTPIRHIAAR